MELLTYVRALRRRWLLVVVCVVVGAAVGYSTTLLHDQGGRTKKGRTYYEATNTVIVDYGSNSSGIPPAYSNLDQIALVVTNGDVPDRVAQQLQTPESGRELGQHVVTTTSSTTSTLEISVADPDRDRAVKIADTFAAELDNVLQASDQQRYDTYVASLKSTIDGLQKQGNDLLGKIRAIPPPPDIDTIQEQYDATQSQYHTRYSQLISAESGGPATTTATVLESAEADPISASEYASRLELGATGQNHLRADTQNSSAALATGTSSSSFNSPSGRAFAGGFLGLLIGLGLVLALDRFDHRLRTREEVEAAFQFPVLAEIPRLSRKDQAEDQLVAFSAPLSRVAEAFRAVCTSLLFQQSMATDSYGARSENGNGHGNGNGQHARVGDGGVSEPLVVMVTSAAPREGKSTTSANLAVAFAESGKSVLVVNCDFRRPTIHRRFGVFDEARRVQDTKVPGIKIVTNVLPDASANPSQVVAAQRQVISARSRFDVVVLDTAPMLTANDAVGIVNVVDQVLMVAQLDMTTTDNARRVMELLGRVHATVGGVVLIGSSETSNEYYYYYQRGRVPQQTRTGADANVGTAPGGLDPASEVPTTETSDGSPTPVASGVDAPRDIFGEAETGTNP